MKTISLKMEESFLDEIDKNLAKHRCNTRTEFIRSAIRKKLSDKEKEELKKHIASLVGISKRKTTDEMLHKARKEAFEELERLNKKTKNKT